MHLTDIEDFLFEIINIAKGKVAALKPQVAFFEEWGPEGLSLLSKISNFGKDLDLPIIMDAKRGDIGNTAKQYAASIFGHFGFDSVTLSPYMGEDSIMPFLTNKEKGVFILCKTSNPSASDFQNLQQNDKKLFELVAEKCFIWNEKD